ARPINVRDAGEIERAITGFARSGNGGLIVTGSGLAAVHRDVLVTLAARHRLPAVYFEGRRTKAVNGRLKEALTPYPRGLLGFPSRRPSKLSRICESCSPIIFGTL